jgi:hypothetical protein
VVESRPGLVAVALAMAAILDNPLAITSQPAAARQLAAVLDVLHKHQVRRGRLAAVRTKTALVSRVGEGSPDAGWMTAGTVSGGCGRVWAPRMVMDCVDE